MSILEEAANVAGNADFVAGTEEYMNLLMEGYAKNDFHEELGHEIAIVTCDLMERWMDRTTVESFTLSCLFSAAKLVAANITAMETKNPEEIKQMLTAFHTTYAIAVVDMLHELGLCLEEED